MSRLPRRPVIPLGQAGAPRAQVCDLHVPSPTQSAVAGVLLAAAPIRPTLEGPLPVIAVTRTNVPRVLGDELTQPALAVGVRVCICEGLDFRQVYIHKYTAAEPTPDS